MCFRGPHALGALESQLASRGVTMARPSIWIQRFDPATARVDAIQGFHTLSNAVRGEKWPEDPPRSLPVLRTMLRTVPKVWGVQWWVAWHRGRVVGSAELELSRMEENRHLAWCDISVLPSHRRRGIASALLSALTEAAAEDGRRLLGAATYSTAPSGEAFMRWLGAQAALTQDINQLAIADVDRELLRSWQRGVPAQEFELGFWEGAYPEDALEEMVAMAEVMNTAPRGDLDMEDWHITPEMIRDHEETMLRRGTERWTVYVRHKESGRMAGYTEVGWNPHEPEMVHQWATAVFPEFRKRGLGRWIKAAMMEKIIARRPGAKFVRTGNANMNAAMLNINHELGFTLYNTETEWQIPIEHVREKGTG